MTALYSGRNTSDIKLYPPPTGLYNDTFSWEVKRFVKTKLASDSLEREFFKKKDKGYLNKVIAFHKKFGAGYMMVSYPQYNAKTNKLVIEDWLEDAGWCGTGKDTKYTFEKTANGWKEL
ncbi:hypothetical protein [Mucilaginibacter myungsuensis]|uniref:Uncharacterized protein n=1 Tax=Mucilaginibacter myungsuensis TaxID=649104 RepID=A0A929L575_9SPHI|nr:hypothetical protein [Mucilaginibacter myungsuensis]MBE9664679.1 hypothetical protein [Mucilaginibacter myungsuensis]MDN3601464.1 hypothetical protein [Mucilaginibacter myungsuensis]